jgi:hypothetical protein
MHTVRSGGCGAPAQHHFSPAPEHDRPQLTSDESWRGCGLLAALCCVRWEVKLSLRVGKSVRRLGSIDAERPCSLKALLHASLIAPCTLALGLALSDLLAVDRPGPRAEGALPKKSVLSLIYCRFNILDLSMPLSILNFWAKPAEGDEATRRWAKTAALLTHAGRGPEGRRRPSGVDQLRGWQRQPLARQKSTSGHLSHGHLKAAA